MDLSVVIITLNEEQKLPRCLASLPKDAEIIVLDSNSKDKTSEVASKYHAKVASRTFDNYANQKNAAINLASRQWILSLDADEVLSDELRKEIANICSPEQESKTKSTAYKINRRLFFLGKLLRFGKSSDTPLRLFKKGEAEFVGNIHERLIARANIKTEIINSSTAFICHHSYDDLEDYFQKFNHYTTVMAERAFAEKRSNVKGLMLRPWLEFVWRYIFCLGFLDGYEGFCYAYISSAYKFVKYAKLRELNGKIRTNAKD